MVVFLKKNGQINLPLEVLKTMCLEEGDSFEIECKEGEIVLKIPHFTSRKFYNFIDEKVKTLLKEDKWKIEEINSPEEMLRKLIIFLEEEKKAKSTLKK